VGTTQRKYLQRLWVKIWISGTSSPVMLWILVNGEGTGIRGQKSGLVTLPLRCNQEPLVVKDKDGRPPRGPPGGALLLCGL